MMIRKIALALEPDWSPWGDSRGAMNPHSCRFRPGPHARQVGPTWTSLTDPGGGPRWLAHPGLA